MPAVRGLARNAGRILLDFPAEYQGICGPRNLNKHAAHVEVMLSEQPKGGNGKSTQELAFDFIKSALFRVIHADGIIGGPTPQGYLHFAFYSERPPIPRRMVHTLSDTGSLGEPLMDKMVVRDAIVREMDIDVIMNWQVAEQFHIWLGDRLKEMKASRREPKE